MDRKRFNLITPTLAIEYTTLPNFIKLIQQALRKNATQTIMKPRQLIDTMAIRLTSLSNDNGQVNNDSLINKFKTTKVLSTNLILESITNQHSFANFFTSRQIGENKITLCPCSADFSELLYLKKL